MRVAIVGCGKIADQHLLAIDRIEGCSVVAVSDQEPLMAKQLAERFHVDRCFESVTEMLSECRPDVVHITTPPQSHVALARQCIEAGVHVYVEKPFTVTSLEAQHLFNLASVRGVALTAGHNYQFTREMIAMRRLVGEGYLGGDVVHLESHWSYDLQDMSYVAPMLGDVNHWVRRLPGQLFHNLLSHGIARLAEFLDDEVAELHVTAHQSAQLRQLGGQEMLDELRVLLRDGRGTTAMFSFSTQIKPGINRLAVYGPKNSITVDLTSGSIVLHANRNFKSYLTYVGPPLSLMWQQFRNASSNLVAIARQRLYQDAGMTELIRRFYHSIRTKQEPPISSREIVLTSRIMDEIFARAYEPSRQPSEMNVG